jgi:hypothetical protein
VSRGHYDLWSHKGSRALDARSVSGNVDLAASIPWWATLVETNAVILADYSGVQILSRGGSDCTNDRYAGE